MREGEVGSGELGVPTPHSLLPIPYSPHSPLPNSGTMSKCH